MTHSDDTNKRMISLSVILILFIYSPDAFSQLQTRQDTLKRILGGSLAKIPDVKYFTLNDSALVLPSGLYREPAAAAAASGTFYDSIKIKARKKFLTKALVSMVIVKPDSLDLKRISIRSEERFDKYKGYRIRKITVERLDVFGTTVNNPGAVHNSSKLESFLNDTHVNTNEKIIRKNLVFSEGDSISPIKLSENERVLRQLPYIDDARIIVVPVSSDEADIVVVTKDVYSVGANYNLKSKNRGSVFLFDKNIFGSGHELQLEIPYSVKNPDSPGIGLTYFLNNISKSFINLTLSYYNGLGKTSYGISAIRNLVTSETKYAGGITINQVFTSTNLDTLPVAAPLHYNYQDYYVMRSFLLDRDKVQRLIAGLRFIDDNIYERPNILPNSYYALQKKALLLGSLTFSQQKFYKTNLVYSYGRAEDLPHGGMIRITEGIERNEFKNRAYMSVDGAIGGSLERLGYFQISSGLGGFLRSMSPEQGVLVSNLMYVSNLAMAGRSRIRNFVSVSFTRGFSRYTDEYIGILQQNGFSGYWNDSLKAGQRLMVSLESVVFTPWNYMGFRFAVFGFTDFALLAGTKQLISEGAFLTGLGVGIRIRNDNLVFNTFQIRIGFFPYAPEYSRENHFLISGEELLRPNTFDPGPPATIVYR